MKILLFSLALTPVQAGTSCNVPVESIGRPVVQCVVSEAQRLERSKEPARDIAVAAVASCQPVFKTFGDAMSLCRDNGPEILVAASEKLRAVARDAAIARIVAIRARANP